MRLRMNIRAARQEEAQALADIAWAAKASWGYSAAQLEAWRADLTPNAGSAFARPTFVAELCGQLAGFCQVSVGNGSVELEHLWVRPEFMRQGAGRALLARAAEHLSSIGIASLHIDSDPNAEPFYLACGAVRAGEVAAPIDGQSHRVRPQLRLATE